MPLLLLLLLYCYECLLLLLTAAAITAVDRWGGILLEVETLIVTFEWADN